jgi:hypothetical protein
VGVLLYVYCATQNLQREKIFFNKGKPKDFCAAVFETKEAAVSVMLAS